MNRTTHGDRTIFETPAEGLRDIVNALLLSGYRLALVSGHHDPTTLRVVYVLVAGPPDSRIEIHVTVPVDEPVVPSLADLSFPASRFERELHDLFGIVPAGHPALTRLAHHQHWPEMWHPLRHDAGPPPPFGDETDEPYPFTPVHGPGVYEIPVGPVHAGLIEPGHFRFSVVGETILTMKARLWFVHKGIERLFQGRAPRAGIELAERISGDTAVGHTLAYCLALEDAARATVPPEANLVRAVLLELERIQNHVADLGALCNDVGFGIIHAHTQRIREQLLRLNAQVTGHRLLRAGILPGGAAVRSLPTAATLDAVAADVHDLVDIVNGNSTVVDRFTGTATLAPDDARRLGVLGYVARASGLERDARLSQPFANLYDSLHVPLFTDGDVRARFLVRVAEIDASVALLHGLLPDARPGVHGDVDRPLPTALPSGVGLVEGWRGTIAQRVELADDGTLARVKVVDPSFFNWPALAVALADTIVPDFPLANKSFNLSYAGNDL